MPLFKCVVFTSNARQRREEIAKRMKESERRGTHPWEGLTPLHNECLNDRMFECWNGGLGDLGGLESLEFRGKRCPFSNSNSRLELLYQG